MTKVEGYKCDHCKTLYSTSDEAEKCERNHIMITNTRAVYDKEDTYPRNLIVSLADGERAYYSYDAYMCKN